MAKGDWTDEENDLIVADYFAMLADDIAGRPYNKAEHNRRSAAADRPQPDSIEFKHQNISAVLKGLGEDWIPGYKPAVQRPEGAGRCGRPLAERPTRLGSCAFQAVAMPGHATRRRSCGSGRRPHSPTSRRRRSWSRCCTSPASSTWRAATSATARSAARARSACWGTSAPF